MKMVKESERKNDDDVEMMMKLSLKVNMSNDDLKHFSSYHHRHYHLNMNS